MFPTIGHGLWWQAFLLYSFLIAFSVPFLGMLILLIFDCELKGLGEYVLLAWGVWIAVAFIIGYLLANRSAKNYYFDVTEEGVVVRSPENLDFLRTIPFSKILDVVVRAAGSNRYMVEMLPIKWSDARHPLCRRYYFDKATAFALKNYILEKMRK
jgi:hypothetical protein